MIFYLVSLILFEAVIVYLIIKANPPTSYHQREKDLINQYRALRLAYSKGWPYHKCRLLKIGDDTDGKWEHRLPILDDDETCYCGKIICERVGGVIEYKEREVEPDPAGYVVIQSKKEL